MLSALRPDPDDLFSEDGQLKKVKIKCEKCNREIAEFYTPGCIVRYPVCKTCIQVDKLVE